MPFPELRPPRLAASLLSGDCSDPSSEFEKSLALDKEEQGVAVVEGLDDDRSALSVAVDHLGLNLAHSASGVHVGGELAEGAGADVEW